jgi:uncharacterized membrane protein YfcA
VLLLVALGILVGAVAQRVAGMGYALTLAPIMVLVLGPFDGPMVVNIAGAFSSALVYLQSKRSVDWKQFWLLAIPAVLVIVPSALFSVAYSGPALQIVIGVILVFALATSLVAVRSEKFLPRGRLGVIFGASSGFMSVTAGIGGPAMGIYAVLTGWNQKVFAATLQPYFVTLGVTSFLSKFAASGRVPDLSLWMWIGIGVLTIVGSWLGVYLQKFVSVEFARISVIVICFIGSVAAIIDGVLEL